MRELKFLTVFYEVVDIAEWRKSNPLFYQHNGLKSIGVSARNGATDSGMNTKISQVDQLERLRAALEMVKNWDIQQAINPKNNMQLFQLPKSLRIHIEQALAIS